ncbi:MAG: NAD(P)-binding domain-containing protein [Planctomycetota bacterium]
MTPFLLILLCVALALAFAATWQRQGDLRRQRSVVRERAEIEVHSADSQQPLQVPVIDLQKCLGCGTCIRECPEEGVLALVHGQAQVVHAQACVGHARCVSECPAGAVKLTQGDVQKRDDVPVLDGDLRAVGTDGLFLVGEVTARSLIRTATTQGCEVARTIAAQDLGQRGQSATGEVLDAIVVGAGPGGIACALGLREQGLDFAWIDQESQVGGAVVRYPRNKLVLTDVVELPLHGRMPEREYQKEELVALWQGLADEYQLPFQGSTSYERIEHNDDGTLTVATDRGELRARNVVLAVGRRGRPRRLGVPGEDLPHVRYALIDAAAHAGRRCVVVGGGDSAVEAALALSEQEHTQVALVYRRARFLRLRSKNKKRLQQRVGEGAIELVLSADVHAVATDALHVRVRELAGAAPAAATPAPVSGDPGSDDAVVRQESVARSLPCDDLFVMAGGEPPFAQLAESGVRFDHSLHPASADEAPDSGGSGQAANLLWALGFGLVLALAALSFVVWHGDYYFEQAMLRAMDPKHALLRPDQSVGLWFGFLGSAAVLVNLAYLLRRQQLLGVRFGSLASWMNVHVATGVLAVVLVMLHAALSPKSTPGGYAFWGLAVLLVTGAVGRWFYAWLPRAANGRERRLDELRAEAMRLEQSAGSSEFERTARQETLQLVEKRQWSGTWAGRAMALFGLQWDLWRTRRRIRRMAAEHGVAPDELARELHAAGLAHQNAVAVAHLEDLRAVLGTWRWLHRWLALLTVLLILVHVAVAILHGTFSGGGGA